MDELDRAIEMEFRRARNKIIEECAEQAEWFANVEKFTIEEVALRIRQMKTWSLPTREL